MQQTISDLIECFAAWEPDVRVLGNVRAGDAYNAVTALRARVAELEGEAKTSDMMHDSIQDHSYRWIEALKDDIREIYALRGEDPEISRICNRALIDK
jgi:hypothetical protein